MWLPLLYQPSGHAAPILMHETRSRDRTLTVHPSGPMVLRENPDADLPGHHPRGARKTELGTRCVTDVISSLDPADTHHARSNNCQVKSLLLQSRTVRAWQAVRPRTSMNRIRRIRLLNAYALHPSHPSWRPR